LKPASSSSQEDKPDRANLDDEIDITFSLSGRMVATFSRLMHDDRRAIPRSILIVGELPQGAAGKIEKRALRRLVP
jgi:acyl-CoA synthetase (AMP-forming)/AMP-acid ligase II